MPYAGSDNGSHELFFSLDRLAMFWMIIGSMFSALIGLFLYIYFLRKGHFDDEESVKYQIFREDNPDS